MPYISAQLKNFPDAPGIYLFYNSKKELIYVGKATSLKNRVKSYFVGRGVLQYAPTAARPIEEMIHKVARVDYKETNSVLEAVVLEAVYIKKFQPKYNVLGKDDKTWNYLVITKDIFPRLETLRQHEFVLLDEKTRRKKFLKIFGPFPGLNSKEFLKLLRKLFKYSTCAPRRDHSAFGLAPKILAVARRESKKARPCLYYEMGQCLGVCTGEISPAEYRALVIRPLALFLGGKTAAAQKYFKGQMRAASRDQRFEDAARLRDQIKSFKRIQDISLINQSWFDWALDKNNQSLESKVQRPMRIEGYDISNLGPSEKVGSMVVFENGMPKKSDYRKFIIKTVPGQNDVASLSEVLTRRLRHADWPLPDLFLIDGGRPQVSAASRVVGAYCNTPLRSAIAVIGIAKGRGRKRNDIILGPGTRPLLLWFEGHRKLLIQVRDEAHRFAITFHRARRHKAFGL